MGRAKLKDDLLKAIVEEAGGRFHHSAYALSSVTGFKISATNPDLGEKLGMDYTRKMATAAGELADLLSQALIARRMTITLLVRREIVSEALRFASRLANWEKSGNWLAWALGLNPETDKDRINQRLRSDFLRSVNLSAPFLAEDVDGKISLRCLISNSSSRPLPEKNLAKLTIAQIKADNPGITQLRICQKLDMGSVTLALPKSWETHGVRTWIDVLKHPNLKLKVKPYLSKVLPAKT